MDAERAAVESLSSTNPIREHDPIGAKIDPEHRVRGGNGLAHSFISRQTRDLPILVVLQKPGLVPSYDVAEANALLASQKLQLFS
jgi:hypothetical protein